MERPLTKHITIGGDPLNLAEYEKVGGYEACRKSLRTLIPDNILQLVKDIALKVKTKTGISLSWEVEYLE